MDFGIAQNKIDIVVENQVLYLVDLLKSIYRLYFDIKSKSTFYTMVACPNHPPPPSPSHTHCRSKLIVHNLIEKTLDPTCHKNEAIPLQTFFDIVMFY